MNAGFVFFNHDMPNWLTMNVCSTRTKREVKWSPMFEIIVDRIWSRRNEFIFSNKWANTLGLVLSVWSGVCDISRRKLTHMILAPNDDNDNHDASGRWMKPRRVHRKLIVVALTLPRRLLPLVVLCFEMINVIF